jgi:hypothetical protein
LPNVAAISSAGWLQFLVLSFGRFITWILPARGVSELQGVLIILALLGVGYAAGYYTRDRISRSRREHARLWKNYLEPEWPRPANTNQAPQKKTHGDLGQMLDRWEDRARVRRSHR